MSKWTDPKCGKSWGGLVAEHCTACHETFSGTTAGDRHRKGPGPARRCVPPGSVGLVLHEARGVWQLPGRDEQRAVTFADGRRPWGGDPT